MFAGKDVDLPHETLIRNTVARLLDDDADRVLQQFLGIGDRDVVFEFVTSDGAAADLDRQSRLPAIEDTHPDGTIVHGGDIALLQCRLRLDGGTPSIAAYEELPLDLFRHTGEPFVTMPHGSPLCRDFIPTLS